MEEMCGIRKGTHSEPGATVEHRDRRTIQRLHGEVRSKLTRIRDETHGAAYGGTHGILVEECTEKLIERTQK